MTRRVRILAIRQPLDPERFVAAQLRAALPGIRLTPEPARSSASLSAALEVRLSSVTEALRTDAPEAVAAGLLATLQPLRSGEVAVVQWVLTPAAASEVPPA